MSLIQISYVNPKISNRSASVYINCNDIIELIPNGASNTMLVHRNGNKYNVSESIVALSTRIDIQCGGGGGQGSNGASAYEVAVSQGFVGDESAWLASLVGPKGDTGTAGAAGSDGAQGAQGPKGDTGAAGSQGVKGDTGSQGLKGDTGSQGLKGDTGAAGSQGLKGDTGSQGLKGDTGSQGLKGDTGAAGPAGTASTDLNLQISATVVDNKGGSFTSSIAGYFYLPAGTINDAAGTTQACVRVTNTSGDQTTVAGDVIIYDLVTGDEIGNFNTVSSTTEITSTPSYNAKINPTGSWVYVKVAATGTASANAEVKLYGIRIVYV